MRLQWVPCEPMCGRCLGQCTLNSKLLKWHQYRVSETHDVMLTSCYHRVWLWLPRWVPLPTEVLSVRPCQNHHFPQVSHAPPLITDRSVLKMLQGPLQPGLSYVTILMVIGDSSLDWLSQMEMCCPSIMPLCECSGLSFQQVTLLRDPRNPRLCHFLRKWCLLRTKKKKMMLIENQHKITGINQNVCWWLSWATHSTLN